MTHFRPTLAPFFFALLALNACAAPEGPPAETDASPDARDVGATDASALDQNTPAVDAPSMRDAGDSSMRDVTTGDATRDAMGDASDAVGDASDGAPACTGATCGENGQCADADAGARCRCDTGWAGERCDRCDDATGFHADGAGGCTRDGCVPSPCSDPARARCSVVMGAARCDCNAGTHEEGARCVDDVTCSPTTCSGHGTCAMTAGTTRCTCAAGFAGERCETCAMGFHADGAGGCSDDPCTPSPCTAPMRSRCTASMGAAVCACDAGHHLDGDRCVVDEACTSASCNAHGACSVAMGTLSCACATGFSGARCDGCAPGFHADGRGGCTTDVCVPNPCTTAHQSVCTVAMAMARCGCDTGYHSDGVGGCTDDPCRPDPCAASMRACRVTAGAAECYAPMCDDRNPCTDDRFDGTRCVFTARANGASCNTGLCRTGETCTAGACTGGAAVVCDDRNPCTRDRCDATAGCVAPTDDTLVPDDGIACTTDRCAAGIASHAASNAVCDDGRYCTGEESCVPGVGADARGCVTRNVPVAPGVDTACRRYVCNDAMRAFVATTAAPGSSCDDGLACTTSDVCDSAGACLGTATATCAPPTGTCTSLMRPGTSIDFGAGTVRGRFTMNGTTLPTSSRSSASFIYYLRATDTGALHEMGRVSYSGSYPNYVRGADTYSLLVPAGVYDVLIRRSYDSATQVVYAPDGADSTPNAYRVQMANVVIPRGGRTLDVDFRATTVSGRFTMNGATIPASSRSSASFIYYLRDTTTAALYEIGRVSYSGSYPNYARGADTYSILVPSGTYDLLARRSYDSATQIVYAPDGTDSTPNIYRVLQRAMTVAGSTQTLNPDFGATTISGRFTMNGSAIPASSRSSASFIYYLRDTTTAALYEIGRVSYSGSYPNYARGADTYTLLIPSGTYDLLARRSYDSATQTVYAPDGTDSTPNIYRVLRTALVVTGSTQTLNPDFGTTTISGRFTMNGAAIPASSRSSASFIYYLRATDTGALHELGRVSYSGSYPSYVRGADTYSLLVPSGSYDVLARRSYDSSTQTVYAPDGADSTPNIYRVLQRGLTVTGGAQTLNPDFGTTAVSGRFTINGAAIPSTSRSSASFIYYLRATDTGALHELGRVSYSGSYPSYVRGVDTYSLLVPSGSYDIIARRSYDSATQIVYSPDAADSTPNIYRVLRNAVTLSGSTQTLDVDFGSASLAGGVTMNGEALPASSRSSASFIFYLQARDTGALHEIARVSYSGSYPAYVRQSDAWRTLLPTGAYDLLARRSYDSATQIVYAPDGADTTPNIYRYLGTCQEVR